MRVPTFISSFGVAEISQSAASHRKQTGARIATTLMGLGLTLFVAGAAYAIPPADEVGPGFLPNPVTVVSTVPPNGDLNPYGVAFVPPGFPTGGTTSPGDILVSNFNSSANLQATGTTIVRVPTTGANTVFYQGPAGLGLTTALNVLRAGVVVVGNLPTTDGSCATATAGSLLVLDRSGHLVSTLTDATLINGPWDSTVFDEGNHAQLFVSNVLSGGLTRFDLNVWPGGVTVVKSLQIASGYSHRCDPAALVVGPTGLAYDSSRDILYVASTEDNAVYAVHGAGHATTDHGPGTVIYTDATHLHGPLGLVLAPDGHLIASNSDVINSDPTQPSELVEFTPQGQFVKQLSMDPAQGGSFGLALARSADDTIRFAAVDDNASNMTIWTLPNPQPDRFFFSFSAPLNTDPTRLQSAQSSAASR
jgi:hypothetical protein